MTSERMANAVPTHVPAELVVDFDIYNLPNSEVDPHLAWRCFLGKGPLVFSSKNMGHWVATRGKDIARFYRDTEHFSSAQIIIPQPEMEKMLPLQADPPEHAKYRANIQVLLTPKAVGALESSIRDLAVQLIEEFRGRGECEFVSEFALQYPLIIFLRMMGLPLDDRDTLRRLVEEYNYNPDLGAKMKAHLAMHTYLEKWIEKRLADPGDDAISHITRSTIDGRPYSRQEMLSTFTMLLQAGLDTVAMMLSFIALHLARHPLNRKYIRDNPERMNPIIQELLRRFSGPHMARVLKSDYVHEGVLMKRGDKIVLVNSLFNLDETEMDNPDTVDFTRDARHITFGSGPHTCAGALLARKEIEIFLKEWLGRIPEFEEDAQRPVKMKAAPQNHVSALWLRWQPTA